MYKQKSSIWLTIGLALLLVGVMLLLTNELSATAVSPPIKQPETVAISHGDVSPSATNALGDPTSITMDENGYTIWEYEYPTNWCVPYSRIRWPFSLGEQDPSELSGAALTFTFAQSFNAGSNNVITNPIWGVALNGDPGPLVDGSFSGEWNSIGTISTVPHSGYNYFVEQEVTFDSINLIDGENNIWFQQQDFCPLDELYDQACTCYLLKKIQLRAKVNLSIKSVSPESNVANVLYEQNEDSEIRVKFTTPVSPTTVNENTLQVYYFNQDLEPVYASGKVRQLSTVEYAFVPDQPLKDGVRYEARVWGETDAQDEGHSYWVKDNSGGPLKNGQLWTFWTMPELEVRLEPVQVLEDATLIANKPTALRVFVGSADPHLDVWKYDVWEYVDVEDIQIAWGTPSGQNGGTVSWRKNATNWHFAYTRQTARRYNSPSDEGLNYYGFVPKEAGTHTVLATVTLLDNHGDPRDFSTHVSPVVMVAPILNIRNVLIARGSEAGKTGTDGSMGPIITSHQRTVQATYPVPSVKVTPASSAIPFYNFSSIWWNGSIQPWSHAFLMKAALVNLNSLCLISSNCDLIVGYADPSWMIDNGLTTLPETIAPRSTLVNYSYDPRGLYSFLVAHEEGHLFGFEHATRSCKGGYDVQARTPKGIRPGCVDFMHIDGLQQAGTPELWIAPTRYSSLISQIATTSQALQQSTSADPLLLATGFITPTTGNVGLNPWYQLEAGEWEEPSSGPYQLVFLNSAGQEIIGFTRSFAVSGGLQPAASGTTVHSNSDNEPEAFNLMVPYPAAATRIQIRRDADDALLAERELNAAAPTVSIDPPSSNTWSGAQPISWQTDGSGDRYSIVLLSLDNGATWDAQTIDLSDTAFTIETAGLPNSSQVMVRVLTSDGVVTSSDTAGPFSIVNPLKVDYVSPVMDEERVNVSQPIYVGFRQAMDPTTIHGGTITLSGGHYGTVPADISYDTDTYEITFIPTTQLAYNTLYTAHISSGINAPDGTPLAESFTWSFTTEVDSSPPHPDLVSPPNGTIRAPRNTAVSIIWDRDLNVGTLTAARFQVTDVNGAAVNGSIAYDAATQTAVFTPQTPLAPYTTYIVTLAAGIEDTQGNASIDPTVWSFTTGDTNPALAFTGIYADWGQDDNGDNLYEQLIIRVGVQVTTTGSHMLSGVLVDKNGGRIALAHVETSLTAGSHFIDLTFSGTAVGGHSIDGPYTLTELTLIHMSSEATPQPLESISQQNAYRTFAYPADRFPATLHFSGLPDVVILPENTFLNAFNVHDYVQHAILPSDQISYTIAFNSDPSVAVELQSSGAVHLNTDPYWRGNTTITIRATDGVYAVQSSFSVLVGWPYSLYLPVITHNSNGASTPNTRSALITAFSDDFETDDYIWSHYSSISTPPYGPGGWYHWGKRDCRAYSGQYSAWAYGGGDDGAALDCEAAYPYTLSSTMFRATPINLKYVSQGIYNAKVWTNLAPGAEVCLKVAVANSNSCKGDWGPIIPIDLYHGICQTGQTNGWTDLSLDLANVPELGSVLNEEHVCIAINFSAGESAETRPEGAYVDDVTLQVCPEGLEDYCDLAAATNSVPTAPAIVTNSIGGYPESITGMSMAVEANGHVHALWTGKLNPLFNDYVFYSSSADGVHWTPYQILDYWNGRDPQIAVDNIHGRVHLAYGSNDGIIHRTVTDGVVSASTVVAPFQTYYKLGHPLPSGAVMQPDLTVAEETGYAYLVWNEHYSVDNNNGLYSVRAITWHAYWDGTTWSEPLRKINDSDTGHASLVATPNGRVMLAWFQQLQQSVGNETSPGDPMVARTAYGTEPGRFPLRQATHDLYEVPERDDTILLTYSGGDDTFVLVSSHFMWPTHSQAYRYVWQNGVWSEPLNVAENVSGVGSPVYVGAASNTPLVRYVYSDNWVLKTRTETNGVLNAAQTMVNYLTTRGYSNASPLAYFTDANGGLHMIVSGEKNGAAGVYYVRP